MSAAADKTQLDESAPWFKHGIVWFVLLVPLSSVLFGVVMLVAAGIYPSDPVVDDYYREGKGINQRLARDRRAAELQVSASISEISAEGVLLRASPASETLQVSLFHVADRRRDLRLTFSHVSNGIYLPDAANPGRLLASPGIWYIEITDRELGWRLRKRVATPVSRIAFSPDVSPDVKADGLDNRLNRGVDHG